MQTVQHTKHFAHPANWAGFLLVGSNVRLSNKVAMGHALCELLRTPERCRDALRVCLHLVEKSLLRLPLAELRQLRLSARLVVMSSYHSVEPITGAGVAQLAGGWLLAGAGAVLISLWPVPETAAKILLRAFYSALLQGARAAR